MKKIFVLLFLGVSELLIAQGIRVETFIGTEAPILDAFWLKPVAQHSSFLFLSRNKFSIPEYASGTDQFSTLNILAYQFKKTGFGIAIAATARTNSPFQARAGIQFLKVQPKKWLLYTIISSKLGNEADARWLTIFQYTPSININWQLFTRAEWVTAIGFSDTHRFSNAIIRLGLKRNHWQFGIGSEVLWLEKKFQTTHPNVGFFVAHVF